MHFIELAEVNHSEKALTQAVLQITQMLGIYHAELARILHFKCADIGAISNGKKLILKSSVAWVQAEKYVLLYQRLYVFFEGSEILINNWLRKHNKKLNAIPLYVMVDELRIDDVVEMIHV